MNIESLTWWDCAVLVALAVLLEIYRRRQLSRAMQAFRAELLHQIETKRAERLLEDAELCEWLLLWTKTAKATLKEAQGVIDEIKSVLVIEVVDDTGGDAGGNDGPVN